METGGMDEVDTRAGRIRAGVFWIGALAVIWTVGAPIQMAMAKVSAEQATLGEGLPDDGLILASAILVANLVPAGAMAGLWVWGRRRPRPAMTAALALYAMVAFLNGILSPGTLVGTLLVALITLVILGRGLKAAVS